MAAKLRLKFELDETPEYNKEALKRLFEEEVSPTHRMVQEVKFRLPPEIVYDHHVKSGLMDKRLESRPSFASLAHNRTILETDNVMSEYDQPFVSVMSGYDQPVVSNKVKDYVMTSIDGDNEEDTDADNDDTDADNDEDPGDQSIDLDMLLNDAYEIALEDEADRQAVSWSPYLGCDEDSVRRAVRGHDLGILVSRHGGSLYTVRMRMCFDRGIIILRRGPGDITYLSMNELKHIIPWPHTKDYLKKLGKKDKIEESTTGIILDTHHCIVDFESGKKKKKLFRSSRRRSLRFFLIFGDEGQLTTFTDICHSFQEYSEIKPFTVAQK